MSPVLVNAVFGFELLLSAAGLVLLWRCVVSPRARSRAATSALPEWNPEPLEFILLLLLIMFGSFVFASAAGLLVKSLGLTGDRAAITAGAGAQFGMLAGVLTYGAWSRSFRQNAAQSLGSVLKSGVVTFAISVPILQASGKAWELLLQAFGLPAERQDLIRIFADARSPLLITALVVLATIVAPVTEELVFRAGLFRFLRTRAPRFLALLVPGLIFASLHVNWATLEGFASFAPLLVLALLFSVAYERTGHIGTAIIAHGLFNLNTVVLIFGGVGT